MSTSTRVDGCFLPGAKFSRFSATWATKRFRTPARRAESPRSHLHIPYQSARPHGHACSGLVLLDLGWTIRRKRDRPRTPMYRPAPLLRPRSGSRCTAHGRFIVGAGLAESPSVSEPVYNVGADRLQVGWCGGSASIRMAILQRVRRDRAESAGGGK